MTTRETCVCVCACVRVCVSVCLCESCGWYFYESGQKKTESFTKKKGEGSCGFIYILRPVQAHTLSNTNMHKCKYTIHTYKNAWTDTRKEGSWECTEQADRNSRGQCYESPCAVVWSVGRLDALQILEFVQGEIEEHRHYRQGFRRFSNRG